MEHTESSLMKLNKEDLVRLLLDYQCTFNSIHFKNNFDELKTKFTRLETDLNISKNINSKLSDRLINFDRESFANEQYSKREYLEIPGIPPSVKDNELETKVLSIREEIDASVCLD